MATESITTRSVSDVPWADVRAVFGTRGDPAGCWCQFFKIGSAEFSGSPAQHLEALLCNQVKDQDVPPGVIAYLDGKPVGWCAVEPRSKYPRILRSKVVTGGSQESPEDGTVWAVSCFVVRTGYRRRGVSVELLNAAIAQARRLGARVIEGYPIDTAERKASSADLYHGPLSLFQNAGFEIVSRPLHGRAVVRMVLD
ncbi:GNAT family N-acetyltransferase [Glaciihabitans sp. UYNi722]|uniref:GNAT family N-acetyltransferase n=1 Tax=Glaciihabitans sp. UYNi722 TaxID=3156344 RepID=UPI003394EC68